MTLDDVKTMEYKPLGDIRGRFSSEEPLVVLGAALEWNATKKWTLDALAHSFKGVKIPVRASDNEFEFFADKKQALSPRTMMAMDEYINIIARPNQSKNRPPYAGNLSFQNDPALKGKLDTLTKDFCFQNWLPSALNSEYRIWIGAASQKSTIHNDPYHNFNAQIIGSKRFILFEPDQHKVLYPEIHNRGLWVSPINLEDPDLEKFPEFEHAQGYSCQLQPGDILFIPRFWWHCAYATECSVNINRWVTATIPQYWHQNAVARGLVSVDDLIEKISSAFQSLNEDLQAIMRPEFEQMKAEVLKLRSEF